MNRVSDAHLPDEPAGETSPDAGRRIFVRGVAVLGVAALSGVGLAACGDEDAASVQGIDPDPAPVARSTAGPAPAQRSEVEPSATPSRADRAQRTDRPQEPTATTSRAPREPRPAEPDQATPTSAPRDGAPSPLQAKGPAVAEVGDVPVGSGALFEAEEMVITQPQSGTFRGFSAYCPHEGCLIDVFQADEMICTCHGSTFGIADGEVRAGPSKRPPSSIEVLVVDGQIFRAVRKR